MSPDPLRLIAFYLPQFYPTPDNDRWWGKGFTEWTNVTRARRSFAGHFQPQLPADLGFYDLRVPETRHEQAALARAYGIDGFCYHLYWFGGRRMLERPIDALLEAGAPDFPFCFCWANEDWTRNWAGRPDETLIGQRYSDDHARAFVRHLIPFFDDPRYVRVGDRPLLIVYRVGTLPDPLRMTAIWRDTLRASARPEPWLVAAETYGFGADPRRLGFDAAVEFPPHNTTPYLALGRVRVTDPRFGRDVRSYAAMAAELMARRLPDYPLLRTVVPAWDNTARRQEGATVFWGSSPEAYRVWLEHAIAQTRARRDGGERIVFVNAWNEWAEGCHLEPDQRYGRQYLEATLAARRAASDRGPRERADA